MDSARAGRRVAVVWLALCGLGWVPGAQAQAPDAAAAEALLKGSKCAKCHSVDKKKDGPSFKETAAKYKGKADAEQRLVTHLTTSPKIRIDGVEEEHTAVATRSDAEVRNLVRWILAR